jgi:hypothetical protein
MPSEIFAADISAYGQDDIASFCHLVGNKMMGLMKKWRIIKSFLAFLRFY